MISRNPNTNPAVDFHSMFCGSCGGPLDAGHNTECKDLPQKFCTQCGQLKHDYVCAPDPRRLERYGLVASSATPAVKKPLKPIF